jgi:hypothetical protein
VNGAVVNQAHIAPSAVFTVDFDYTSVGTGAFCPGCVVQLYVGLSPEAATGAPSGSSNACYVNTVFNNVSQTGHVRISLTAPATNGIFYLAVDSTLDFFCHTGGLPSGNPSPTQYIGAISVY